MGAHSADGQTPDPIPHDSPVSGDGDAPPPGDATPTPHSLRRRWRRQPRGDRRLQAAAAVVVVIAALVAAIGFTSGVQSRAEPQPADHTAIRAAVDAVTALMTFTPGDTPKQRAAVAEHLTGALSADFAARGPDVVFPDARASDISMKTTVSSAALGDRHGELARVLIFATQEIVVGKQQDYPTRVGIARWATVSKVNDVWRLSRVTTVSPQ